MIGSENKPVKNFACQTYRVISNSSGFGIPWIGVGLLPKVKFCIH